MNKIHIFDCDGVLFDTNKVKILHFQKTLEYFFDDQKKIYECTKYFKNNFGLTRVEHFKRVGDKFNLNSDMETKLERLYSSKTSKIYSDESKIKENFNFVQTLDPRNAFIASASTENHLKEQIPPISIFKKNNIFGSPSSKVDNLQKIVSNNANAEFLFYGDSLNDAVAAKKININFIGLFGYSNNREDLIDYCNLNNFITMESLWGKEL